MGGGITDSHNCCAMRWDDIFAAIVTSLIASVVFWFVFNVIPNKVERSKIKPLLDFDLYHIYTRLAHFLDVPFYHSLHSPSYLQMRLFTGAIKKEDYRLYLATKCLTEEHKKVNETARNMIPIGSRLKSIADDILDSIQNIYMFNKYLTAEQILLCRKIADKITTYDFEMMAFERIENHVLVPVDPTMRGMESMFYETYTLFLQLQDYLVNQKPTGDELGDFYKDLLYRKLGLLYCQGKYKKVARMAKNFKNVNTRAFYFRSLYRQDETEKGLAALKDFLLKESMQLIYMRGYFEEFMDDEKIRNILIAKRSEKEYQEMIDCINKEREQQEAFEKFAAEMGAFYDNKMKR